MENLLKALAPFTFSPAAGETCESLTTAWMMATFAQGYNLGHHRIPSNKFLLYDHATRIPGVIHGPGIMPGEYP